MPTDSWLAAAKNENRKPVVLMQIEDAAAEEHLYTTRSDWEGSTTLTNINTTEDIGSAIGEKSQVPTYLGGLNFSFLSSVAGRLRKTTPIFSAPLPGGANASDTVTGYLRTGSTVGPIVATDSNVINFNSSGIGSAVYSFIDFEMSAATTYYLTFTAQIIGSVTASISELLIVPSSGTDCLVQTSTIDIGSIPANPVTLSIDDTLESGTSIAYSALGGNADPPVNNLGAVVDGDSLTAYRYYRITGEISSTTGNRGRIKQFGLREGLFKWYGTHKDLPFRGVKPYLELETLTTLSTTIKLDKGISTTGQFTAVLKWVDDVSDFVATRALRGKDVQLLYGFQQLSQSDYEPIFTGTWFDYSFDDTAQTITVKCQDILKQFDKIKLPTEEYNASGVKTSVDIPYLKANGVNTLVNLYDKLGIRDRYISDEYATLEGGDLSGTDYNITRTLSKPIEANKLIEQLAQTMGLFLVPQGNGELFPYLYDETDPAIYTLDASKFSPSSVAGNQDEIATRQYAYYNINDPTVATPNDEEKFDNAYQVVNASAEIKWVNEKTTKVFFDTWRIGNNEINPLTTGTPTPPQALIDLTNRWDSWYAEPKFTVSVKDLPPQWMKVNPSNIVGIDNLSVPVSSQAWDSGTTYDAADIIIYDGRQYESIQDSNLNKTPDSEPTWWKDSNILSSGLTSGMKFIIMKRTVDIRRGSVSLEFRQI